MSETTDMKGTPKPESGTDFIPAMRLKVRGISRSPALELIRKTFRYDLFSPLKFIISIALFIFYPLMVCFMGYQGPTPAASTFATIPYKLVYQIMFSMAFPLVLMLTITPVMSKEFSDKTVLLVDSYSLTRLEILLCKLAAVTLYTGLLIVSALTLVAIPLYIFRGFYDIWGFFLMTLFFALTMAPFYILTFLGFSAWFKKPRFAILSGIFLMTFYFILGGAIPEVVSGSNQYADFHLYLIDLNYHASNIFIHFYDLFDSYTFSVGGFLVDMFSHHYRINHSKPNPYVPTNYLSPWMSFVMLLIIGASIFFIGYIRFRMRELT